MQARKVSGCIPLPRRRHRRTVCRRSGARCRAASRNTSTNLSAAGSGESAPQQQPQPRPATRRPAVRPSDPSRENCLVSFPRLPPYRQHVSNAEITSVEHHVHEKAQAPLVHCVAAGPSRPFQCAPNAIAVQRHAGRVLQIQQSRRSLEERGWATPGYPIAVNNSSNDKCRDGLFNRAHGVSNLRRRRPKAGLRRPVRGSPPARRARFRGGSARTARRRSAGLLGGRCTPPCRAPAG